MLKFPPKHRDTIKKYLLRQKSEVNRNLAEVQKDDPALTPSLAESSEPGTDSSIADSHTKSVAFREQLKAIADNIKKALLKMRRGHYGKCERCSQQIEVGRLLAMPTAQYCLSCSKKATKP